MADGNIFDIKRFALHDGPGIRTTVFMKGCMLACPWCHNPEGISTAAALQYLPSRCIRCGQCAAVCPRQALSLGENGIVIDRSKCSNSGACVEICPSRALVFDGRAVSAEDVMNEVLRDKVFYAASGGGMTLSGGDPLCQPGFAQTLLRGARDAGVHTAVETCLAAEWQVVESLLPWTDLWLIDLKLADDCRHAGISGKGNKVIHENLPRLIAYGAQVIVRIPLIPGVTATQENLAGLGALLRKIAPEAPVEMINFNPLAQSKYQRMGRKYLFEEAGPFTEEELAVFRDAMGKVLSKVE